MLIFPYTFQIMPISTVYCPCVLRPFGVRMSCGRQERPKAAVNALDPAIAKTVRRGLGCLFRSIHCLSHRCHAHHPQGVVFDALSRVREFRVHTVLRCFDSEDDDMETWIEPNAAELNLEGLPPSLQRVVAITTARVLVVTLAPISEALAPTEPDVVPQTDLSQLLGSAEFSPLPQPLDWMPCGPTQRQGRAAQHWRELRPQ